MNKPVEKAMMAPMMITPKHPNRIHIHGPPFFRAAGPVAGGTACEAGGASVPARAPQFVQNSPSLCEPQLVQ
jgi:hypothetical protein